MPWLGSIVKTLLVMREDGAVVRRSIMGGFDGIHLHFLDVVVDNSHDCRYLLTLLGGERRWRPCESWRRSLK
jgi:hypothetical protein